jgi:arginyl-tRNA synthetase
MLDPTPAPTPPIASLRSAVQAAVGRAWVRAVAAGDLPALPSDAERPAIEVERPANPEHGDFATNLAMKLARPYRRAPLEIARALAAALEADATGALEPASPVGSVEVAAPGFVNIRLADAALAAIVAEVLARPADWGRVAAAAPRHVNVEFVSANPTGPLHIGNARGAFVGDLLCRVLEAGGHRVTREYYFNDFGSQVRNLGISVLAIRRGEPVPEDGYRGDYVHELAAAVPAEVWAHANEPDGDAAWTLGLWASERVRAGIEASLEHLGVHFDVWKSEGSLHRDGWVERAIDKLAAGGHTYEQDGALWFRSTAFGDDKDRVILRSNGEPTYFAADIGYVVEKFSRGFDHLVYIWGADHHGTVARVRNAATAMGYDAERVQMILTAWVRFVRDGEEISMSKRAGTFITLDELLAEVGVDAARWFFGSRAPTTGIDFDIELAKKQSNENPVYYVQYAHARIASILRKADGAGLRPADGIGGLLGTLVGAGSDIGVGQGAGGGAAPDAATIAAAVLARRIARLPEVVEDAATAEETHGITAYATELATRFHAFYRDARVVVPEEPERSAERLALCLATQRTIARALGLLGISAPESM